MTGLPWYAHNLKAYEDDTSHLTMLQHGAYRLMLDHYYKKAAPLPAKLEQVHRICRAVAEDEKVAVSAVLAEFFTLESDGLHNDKADRELAKMAEISGKRSTSGKKGAAARGKTQATASANEEANGSANSIANDKQMPPTLNTKHSSSLRSELSAQARPVDPIPGKSLIPDWIPVEAWKGYVEMRNGIRAPLKARAITLTIGKLEVLRRDGEDIGAVLDQSTQNSWRGVFPVKQNGGTNGSGHGEKRTTTDQHLSGIGSLISDIRAGRA